MSPLRTFIQRPIFTTMLLLAVVVFGLNSYPRIGVDSMPEVELPMVTVTTVLPGADPEVVEKNVSQPLEEALNTLSGLESIRSNNYESVSVIVLQFALERPVALAAQDVRDRVQATLRKLPAEIDGSPAVEKLDLQAMPVLTLAMSGPVPIASMTRLADDVLKPALQRIEGVGAVDVYGGRKREITLEIDPVRLRAHGLAATDVTQAVRAQSIAIPGGRTAEAERERVVKLQTEVASVEELRDLVLTFAGGAPVRLRDVANVIDGPAEARSVANLNGRSAVAFVVRKQSGANTVAVAENVKESLGELAKLVPEGSRIELVSDNSRMIRSSINSVQEDLLLGALLAVLVVLLFLRDWRSTIISAVPLPTSIIGTFAAIRFLGYTFNNITMLALTLSIGLLIDDAIVVIENVVRILEKGEKPRAAALVGTSQIALAVLAVTLSVIAVFVPIAFMEGIIGRFFVQFGVTVAVAVAISYAVSMTLIPMLSARLLKAHGPGGRKHGWLFGVLERAFLSMEHGYRRVLTWALGHRAVVLVTVLAAMAVTVGLSRHLQTTFIPPQDSSAIRIDLELPLGTRLEQTEAEALRISEQIRGVPGVVNAFALVGGGVDEAVHKAQVTVNLVPIHERAFGQQQVKQWVREHVSPPPGSTLAVADLSSVQMGSHSQVVQFNVRGDKWEDVVAAAEKTRALLEQDPRFVDVDTTYRAGKPMVSVQLDRDRAATMGVPAAMVGTTLRTLLGGDAFTTYREVGERIDVRVRLPDEVRASPDALAALTLRGASGRLVEIRNLATLQSTTGPSQIDRQALKRQITVLADLKDMALGEAISRIDEVAKDFPSTVQTDFEGQGKELGKTGRAFAGALLLGVLLLFMILAAQFESLLDPFVIMMALPLAIIGALAALLLTGEYLSMFAMIGMIMLMGLVAKNGILLVDCTNQIRRAGAATGDALLEAGPQRLRPILMTTVAMIAGMVPVALARGDGAELRTGMAWAIIGGLFASTVLTLVVVPVIYSLLDGVRARFASRKGAAEEPTPAEARRAA
ncbi:MAG: efflux RND transporter permease subunit [Deltaproteobacteria bacterium]|nr:efflux RND transporter permease subunit [Deltaproteobacteria bacterium]